MPKLPRSFRLRSTRTNSQIIPTRSVALTMNHKNPIPLFLVNGLTPEATPIYVTTPPPQPFLPASLLELSLQGHSQTFTVLLKNQKVMIVYQNPVLLTHLVLEAMRMEMENYNNHVWMSSVLHPPLNYQFPVMPFVHVPTWETSLHPPQNFNQVPVQNFQEVDPLFHHWMMPNPRCNSPLHDINITRVSGLST